MKITFLSLFLIGVKCANITDEEKIYTYTVAVVEYLPIQNNSIPAHEKLNMNSIEYINMLNNISQELDLVLFPEATLEGGIAESTVVPVPYTEIICNSSDTQYQDYLKLFSCAAISYNTTVVINLIEKENCTANNATGFCPSSGIIYYNSNVAFNESGGVIARYRKWNLFGEYGKSPPSKVELVVIKTKNNDSFGMFTCFDIMFSQPALNLTRNLGLKNILFPTMWYSELPYLTALQVQQMWAQENNVNLLSAGANLPRTGTGGTGIFIGKEGPLQYEMIGGEGGSRVIVENVPRPEIEDNPYRVITPIEDDIDAVSKQMDSFFLLTDSSVHNYSSVVLNTNETTIIEEVCNGNDIELCCQFSINISVDQNTVTSNENKYTYHLAAFNGIRTFSGVRDGGIESCGVIACLNESISSCGRRFSNYSEIVWPITFQNIIIVGNFTRNENRIQFPNTLLSSIRPISPQHTTWDKEEINETVKRVHILRTPQNRLLTFGIFGRDFSRDSPNININNKSSETNYVSTILVLVLAFVCYKMNVVNN